MSKKLILLLTTLFFLILIFFSKNLIDLLKDNLTSNQKKNIKKYILPYKYISNIENQLISIEKRFNVTGLDLIRSELAFKNLANNIKTFKTSSLISDDFTFTKFFLTGGFYSGINEVYPGSGFIDFHNDNLLVLSSLGILAYTDLDNNKIEFVQINNNIGQFINEIQFKKRTSVFFWFSLKDLKIIDNKIFISYTDEIKKDCWNISVIFAEINYENINFKKLFTPSSCINTFNNSDHSFNAHQSGGRIIKFDDDNILLSIGDFRERHLSQNKNSVNGKILKINIKNFTHEIISMGNRNPQGLYFDIDNNFILETEHGPNGGDEINLIKLKEINSSNIQNFGWPISSYGEHYEGPGSKSYDKYPLYKSHLKHGFIEPLKYFVPSIGISEITKIGNNKYAFGSMSAKSLYFFELNIENKLINLEKFYVDERIRDLTYLDGKIYMFLENSPSIGIVNLQK